jgi:hypothetical protein
MLIETNCLTCWWIGVKTKVASFKLTKYDLATTYLDTVVSFSLKGIFYSMARQPIVGQGLLIIEASRSYSCTPHSVGLLLTSGQPDAETDTYRTHNTHKRQTSMPPAGFESAIPVSERPQTHALDRAATGIDTVDGNANMNNSGGRKRMYSSTGLRATCFTRGRKRLRVLSLRVTVDENRHLRILTPVKVHRICVSWMYWL